MCVGCPERQGGTTAHLTSIPFAHQSKELLRLGSPSDSLQKMLKGLGHFLLEDKHTDYRIIGPKGNQFEALGFRSAFQPWANPCGGARPGLENQLQGERKPSFLKPGRSLSPPLPAQLLSCTSASC